MVRGMLKKFSLKNFKNFKDEISIDFSKTAGYQFSTDCINDGLISKMLIYGRNATGKTNLGKAFMDISAIMPAASGYARDNFFLNADSAEETAAFSYTFQFGRDELIYRYTKFSNQELQDEELFINGRTIFKCDFAKKEYSFDNLSYIRAETANIERYMQSLLDNEYTEEFIALKLPFLKWLIGNVAFANDSILIQLTNFIQRMMMFTAGSAVRYPFDLLSNSFNRVLEDPVKLQDFEEFLNEMGIKCGLVLRKLPDGRRELYFSHQNLIPFFENASSGTLALADLYRRLISKIQEASFIYLDEFDAFYHYEMSEKVIRFFKKKYPGCQIIMTSHNTNLMVNRLMRPDCLFILSGEGTLTAMCDATQRELREGHNLEKMYISGEFEKYE